MKVIYWYSLAKDMETFCQESVDELAELLSLNYPSLPVLRTQRLSDEMAIDLDAYLCQSPSNTADTPYPELVDKRIIVYCESEDECAINARKINPMAQWGGAAMSLYSMVWKPDKYVFWHEALHLLGVPDSYDSAGNTICEEPNCIMQWEPNQKNCNNTLVLCKNAVVFASASLNGFS